MEGGISFNHCLFAYVTDLLISSLRPGRGCHWREIPRQRPKSIHSGWSQGIWVSHESNRHKEWYLGLSHHLTLDGCLLGLAGGWGCVAGEALGNERLCDYVYWSSSFIYKNHMVGRSIQGASEKVCPWASGLREHLCSCIHKASGKEQ